LLAALIGQARAEAPLECCGMLAGRIEGGAGVVQAQYPLPNEAASPKECVSEARATFDATRDMDRRGLVVLAVYHSHPSTAPVPSKTDLERNYSQNVVTVIVSLQTDPPCVRAWWLRDDGYDPVEMTE
jgi:proteasome lid subunit RPN8/RPN11